MTVRPHRQAKPLFNRIRYLSSDCPIVVTDGRDVFSHYNPLTYHPEIEFQLIIQGTGYYFIHDRRYPFHRNTLLVIPSNAVHCFMPAPHKMFHKITMIVHPRILHPLKEWNRLSQNAGNCLALTEAISVELHNLMLSILRETTQKNPDWKFMIQLKLREFILLMRRAQNQPGLSMPVMNNRVVTSLLSFLEKNYTRLLSIPILAKKAGYSRSYLTRLFKEQVGLGLKQYILHRRIDHAEMLLQEQPNLKTEAISSEVGFGDYSSFHSHFKAMTGFSPSDYRTFSHLLRTNPYSSGNKIVYNLKQKRFCGKRKSKTRGK